MKIQEPFIWLISAWAFKVSCVLPVFYALIIGCGTGNLAEKQVSKSPEDEAREKMNEGDYSAAIELLEAVLRDKPNEYINYSLLAAAYAGRAGLSVFDMMTKSFNQDGNHSVFEQVAGFLPAQITNNNITDLQKAVDTLAKIPGELRTSTGDPDFGSSAEFQYSIYSASLSTMVLKKYATDFSNISADDLKDLTAEDAAVILNSLKNSAASGSSELSQEFAQASKETLDAIEAAPGATDEEKIQNYFSQTS